MNKYNIKNYKPRKQSKKILDRLRRAKYFTPSEYERVKRETELGLRDDYIFRELEN